MNLSLLFTIVLILLACGLVVLLFISGEEVFETVRAVLRLTVGTFLRAIGMGINALLALGWHVTTFVVLVAVGAGWLVYTYWIKPGGFNIARYRPPACTELLDRSGGVLEYLCPGEQVRIWRPLEAIDTKLRILVVMLEDDKFYEHGGLDVEEIWNALEKNLERQKIARGGSTITQQLAKNLFLTREKTLLRKATEVPLALRLEKELTKDQILELYLNTIEWGPGVYGVEAAARLYFDHEAASLTQEETWLLALMIPSPRKLNLWLAPKARGALLYRARHLATRLYLEHHMTKDESKEALVRFTEFIDKWGRTRPRLARDGRKYPVRWSEDRTFSLGEVVAVRHEAQSLIRRARQMPLRSNLDRRVQERLELLDPNVHAHNLSDVIALMDGQQMRAMLPLSTGSSDFLARVREIAQAEGLTTQVFPARNIPASALWP